MRLKVFPAQVAPPFGFTILDLDTLAPLLFILEAGAELRLERTGCG